MFLKLDIFLDSGSSLLVVYCLIIFLAFDFRMGEGIGIVLLSIEGVVSEGLVSIDEFVVNGGL